jgi:glycerol-3-phosphate O-acyltransferase 3/4
VKFVRNRTSYTNSIHKLKSGNKKIHSKIENQLIHLERTLFLIQNPSQFVPIHRMQLPFLVSVSCFVIFALPTLTLFLLGILHKVFGVREKYKELLLFIFERGRERIEKQVRQRRPVDKDDEEQELHDAGPLPPAYVDRDGPCPDFEFSDGFELVTAGIQAIVQDQVTQRFEAEELQSWNLLTRTNHGYEFISWRLTLIWLLGFYIRYLILLPLRVVILFLATVTLIFLTGLVGPIPNGWRFKRWLNDWCCRVSFQTLSRAFSAIITYHDEQYKPNKNGICVANHTSPIDVVILSCNSSFSLIGQSHGGFLGILQRALARASSHIWFDRSEMKDRAAVARRLRVHAQDPSKPPILIFPEGTCINNSAVMQFKKGSFEVDSVIYPVAIKYDPRFGDAFWNSSKHGMLHYVYRM